MKPRIVHGDDMEWQASPAAGVWRKRFELIPGPDGDTETARVTSMVRYDPGCRFPSHSHPLGEEILVLDGTFADEHGEYPAGTYLLNPPGTSHAPRVPDGCTIFVKLKQYAGDGRRRVATQIADIEWKPHPERVGFEVALLYEQEGFPELIHLVKMGAGSEIPTIDMPTGVEFFILDGTLIDEHGTYPPRTWVRFPAGASHAPRTEGGCTYYVCKHR